MADIVKLSVEEFEDVKKILKMRGVGIVSLGRHGNVEIGFGNTGTGLYMFDTGWLTRIWYYSDEEIKNARLDAAGDLVLAGEPSSVSSDDYLRIGDEEGITAVVNYLVNVNAALFKRYKEELIRIHTEDVEDTLGVLE